MGRTNSASTLLAQQLLRMHGITADAAQITGTYYGIVVQTDVSLGLGSSSPIPSGMMTVNIPSLGVNSVSDPLPYPGSVAPPLGTQVSIGFDSSSSPIVLALYGFSSSSGGGSDIDPFFLGG
jgi:hypothetical protein